LGHLNSDNDPPFLNRTCAKPISFSLSPTWMIACDALQDSHRAQAGFSRFRTDRLSVVWSPSLRCAGIGLSFAPSEPCAKAPFSALRAIAGDVSSATFDEYSLVRRAARQDVEQRQ
jgi:hypothetical protein